MDGSKAHRLWIGPGHFEARLSVENIRLMRAATIVSPVFHAAISTWTGNMRG
uniref:Uncharacterized protein n=1 Tax=Rhizobium loti TaxID=381 RepID=Q8KGR2_RHILI|nr:HYPOTHETICAL PROTEIN [Mesorhizobium japonicum R7A]